MIKFFYSSEDSDIFTTEDIESDFLDSLLPFFNCYGKPVYGTIDDSQSPPQLKLIKKYPENLTAFRFPEQLKLVNDDKDKYAGCVTFSTNWLSDDVLEIVVKNSYA
jgi:hypothetical protein